MLAWLLHVRVCATNGLIDFVVYNLPAGASVTRWPVFVALGLLETATMYLVGTFCITRLRMLTLAVKRLPMRSLPSRRARQARLPIKVRW